MRTLTLTLLALTVAAPAFTAEPVPAPGTPPAPPAPAAPAARQVEPVQPAPMGSLDNLQAEGMLLLGGQPSEKDLELARDRGVLRVITLRADGEFDGYDEKAVAQSLGLAFVAVPIAGPAGLTDAAMDQVRELLRDPRPTLLHCEGGNRVGATWLAHRVLDEGVPLETALEEAHRMGLTSAELEARARAYVEARLGPPQ